MAADLLGVRDHARRLQGVSLSQLILDDPARARDFALRVGPIYANFARQDYDRDALAALFDVLRDAGAEAGLRALFDGEKINSTEERAVLHTALRSDLSQAPAAREAHAQAVEARGSMRALVDVLRSGMLTDVVSVGIGGSDLGPRLAVDALSKVGAAAPRVHFLSNVDGHAAQRVLAGLDPATTAGILISKTFGTQETLLNGRLLADWMGAAAAERLYAVSANTERPAEAFGIPPERILPMWDWVGGRYSLWSAVGFPIAVAIGMDAFEELLAGAAGMDAHVLQAPLEQNLAAWHAATAIWNRNIRGRATQAVLPYDDRLKLLANYLQQLVMESLGKSVRRDGTPVAGDTVPVWWGGVGTDTQHSFFQALHQGTSVVPADFIGVVKADTPASDRRYAENHRALQANLLAQTEAFANGQSSDDPHRGYAGGRPSTTFLLDALTPASLGALLAMYEHSVYLQSLAWGINAFDQFGVELGKQVANRLLPALAGETDADDPVTQALLAELRK